MPETFYRFYNLDAAGHIRGAANHPFADDRQAMAHAADFLGDHPAVEVWQTDRLIGLVEREPMLKAG